MPASKKVRNTEVTSPWGRFYLFHFSSNLFNLGWSVQAWTPPLIIIHRRGLEALPTGLWQNGRENEESLCPPGWQFPLWVQSRSFGRLFGSLAGSRPGLNIYLTSLRGHFWTPIPLKGALGFASASNRLCKNAMSRRVRHTLSVCHCMTDSYSWLAAFNSFTWGAGLTHISYKYNIYIKYAI